MKKIIVSVIILLPLLTLCNKLDASDRILGKWIRMSQMGPMSVTFHENGEVTGDFGDDGSVEITSAWSIDGENISFRDKSGVECPGEGLYRLKLNEKYMSFDYISDQCGGRVQSMLGFWVRETYSQDLEELNLRIETEPSPEAYLDRGRIYLALGKTADARKNFDKCIEYDSSNPLYYLHRASTRFPMDMEGAIEDCNRVIELEGEGKKNAYFLRGLAHYELGQKEKACGDFYSAIELGFSILKEAEKEKCSTFWESLISD